jgi:lysyl-tRNA synthetase class 2
MQENLVTKIKNHANVIKMTRKFFEQNDFLEVFTPILTPTPGMEPHLDPFETDLKIDINHPYSQQVKEQKLYLNTSPELQMKKLLAAGLEKIFTITKVFRNGELGGNNHNPEFTMLEWYSQDSNYNNLMDQTENLIKFIAQKLDIRPDLQKNWQRKSVKQLFKEYINIDISKNIDYLKFRKTAEAKDISTEACKTWDDVFFKIFLNKIEPYLGKESPIFVFDYPISQAALAKKNEKDPFFAERVELYIDGIELANGFSELLDSKEQKKRLVEEQNLRIKIGKNPLKIDQDFLEKLDQIKCPSAGIALGLERLIMVLFKIKSIEELLLFPMTKMLDKS